jgi:hypothetical protein
MRYNSSLALNLALDEGGRLVTDADYFTPLYPLNRRLGGPKRGLDGS